MIWLLLSAAVWAGGDLRVVAAPPERGADLVATSVRARVWWSGPSAEVQVAEGGRWRTVGEGNAPVEIPRVARGAAVRIHLNGEWSEPVHVPRTISPAELAQLSGPSGALLAGEVGQIDDGATSGSVWASTVGGGLALAGPRDSVRTFTRWEGMPDDRVLAVSSAGGRVLVGTADGAVMLEDQQVVRTWQLPGTESHAQAVLLTEDAAWVGTSEGLYTLDPLRSLGPGSVYSLVPRGDGGIWLGQGGVRTHGPPEGEMATDVALEGDHIYAILPVPEGIAIAGHERGVWQSGPQGLSPRPDYPDTEAYGLAITGSGLWVAGGASGLHGPGGAVYGYADGLPGRSVWSLLAGEDSESLWVGTDRGLARFSPGLDDHPAQVESLPLVRWPADEDVDDLLPGRRGVWVAGERGIWTLGRPHRHSENLVVAGRSGVVALEQGGGWTWAVGKRVLRMDRRGRMASVPLRFRPTDAAWAEGTLWIASALGLHRLNPETLTLEPVIVLPGVSRVAAEGKRVWAVADGVPVLVVGRVQRAFLRAHPVRDIAPMQGAVCLGTDSGVEHLFQDGEVTSPLGDALAGISVPAVAHDGSGGCWYATDTGIVGRIAADDVHRSLTLQAGEVGVPERIVPDGDWAWVVTRKGTWRVWLPPSAQP